MLDLQRDSKDTRPVKKEKPSITNFWIYTRDRKELVTEGNWTFTFGRESWRTGRHKIFLVFFFSFRRAEPRNIGEVFCSRKSPEAKIGCWIISIQLQARVFLAHAGAFEICRRDPSVRSEIFPWRSHLSALRRGRGPSAGIEPRKGSPPAHVGRSCANPGPLH